MVNIAISEKKAVVKGVLSLYTGKATNIIRDENNRIIKYDFENRQLVKRSSNVICNGFFTLFSSGWNLPCVIAIGNGDNGSIDPNNAPKQADTKLNNELDDGRFDCLDIDGRFNQTSGIATFNALYPSNNYSGLVTEWGLFAGPLGSVALNSKNSGYLVARRAEPYTKDPNDDIDIVWTIGVTLN